MYLNLPEEEQGKLHDRVVDAITQAENERARIEEEKWQILND